jgi:hypothetical protein
MSLPGIVVGAALVLLVLLVLGLPYLRRSAQAPQADAGAQKQRDRVLAYYDRVLQNLRDLDEDHALGKLNAEDYARDRERWVQRGAQALQVLDNLESAPLHSTASGELDEEIESMIARARAPRQPADPA